MLDTLATEAIDKMQRFVPDPPTGLIKQLQSRQNLATNLFDSLTVLDRYANRMTSHGMREKGGYYKRPKGQSGQHYPQIQSFLDRAQMALNRRLV